MPPAPLRSRPAPKTRTSELHALPSKGNPALPTTATLLRWAVEAVQESSGGAVPSSSVDSTKSASFVSSVFSTGRGAGGLRGGATLRGAGGATRISSVSFSSIVASGGALPGRGGGAGNLPAPSRAAGSGVGAAPGSVG